MKDFLINTLLDLSEESEKRFSKVIIKVLYFLNCIIISIWIAEKLGFKMSSDAISYENLVTLFTELYIIIPLFLIVFTTTGARVATRVTAGLIGLIMEPIFYYTFFKKRTLTVLLVDMKAIGHNLIKGEDFEVVKKNLDDLKKILIDGKLWIEYYAALLITFIFIYQIIVIERFTSFYYGWVSILVALLGLVLLSFLGFIYYSETKIKEAEKILELVKP